MDLEILRIGAAEDLLALLAKRDAGTVFLDFVQRTHMAQRLARGGEVLQHAERVARGVHQLDLAAGAALERLARCDPKRMHGFVRVVRALLAFRRDGEEEARIEAPRASRRRDPVAEIGELGCRQVEILGL